MTVKYCNAFSEIVLSSEKDIRWIVGGACLFYGGKKIHLYVNACRLNLPGVLLQHEVHLNDL